MPAEYPRYHVHGLVARRATLELAGAALPAAAATLLPLRFGLVLLPASDELLAALGPSGPSPFIEFVRLTPPLAAFAAEASARGPVVYIEGEMADGAGFHAAVGWRDGAKIYGPLHREDRSPVNQALALLGVVPDAGADAFTTLGVAALC